MIAAVADTHAALWYLFGDIRLSPAARGFIDHAASSRRKVVLSAISLVEVVYLIEKNRLPASAYYDLRKALGVPDYVIEEAPFNSGMVEAMRQVSRTDVPDMPDRIVAGTAVYFRVPVISRDGRIHAAALETIW